ncbi:SCP2 domain-containing protein [Colwelliaceae bacterium 6441]
MNHSLTTLENPKKFPQILFANLPKILKPALTLVPDKLQQALLLKALDSVFKEALEDGDFEFLADKWLKISITDLGLSWLLSYKSNQLIMSSPNSGLTEDVLFSATGDDLILIAGRKEDPDTLFFQRRLKIEGDTELGLEVKNLIDAIDLEYLPSAVNKCVEQLAVFIKKYK